MVTLQYDAEATRRLVAVYRTPEVAAQREAFAAALALRGGERVLDLGAGPGLLALLLAERVGPSGTVCGVDISEPLLAYARSLTAGRPQLRWLKADATSLPLADGEFDAAISTQVLEYVADVDAALAELHRVMRPGAGSSASTATCSWRRGADGRHRRFAGDLRLPQRDDQLSAGTR